MNKKWLPHSITVAACVVSIVLGLACASTPEPQSTAKQNEVQKTQQRAETEEEKFQRLMRADLERVSKGDKETFEENYNTILQPQVITGIGEITDAVLSELVFCPKQIS